ncbi:MAG: hypothetical protein ACKVIY_11160 [Acidimicrobiales bacterium]|mgnify:FL=1|jgi:hypothetical protein
MAAKQGIGDLIDLVKAYGKQELVEPIRPLPRWLAFGIAGSLLLMIGGISLTLAMLRALQTETGTAFTGNLSWTPYLITLVALIATIVLLGMRIKKRSL